MALEGNYKSDRLYLLNSNLGAFRFFNEQLGAVDSEIEQLLSCFSDGVNRNLSTEPVTDPVEKPEIKEVKGKRGRPRKHPSSISRGKSALAAFYRRIAARVGTGKAIVAVCRKLAIIYYNAVAEGIQFVEKGAGCYRKQQEDREKKYLEKLARKHNFALASFSLSN